MLLDNIEGPENEDVDADVVPQEVITASQQVVKIEVTQKISKSKDNYKIIRVKDVARLKSKWT